MDDAQHIGRQQKLVNQMNKINRTQPPLVYFVLGLILGGFWALGTSVQVLTSEAWLMHKALDKISFNAYGQLWEAVHGNLAGGMLVPFFFGWGVQLALIVSSVGVELPKKPAWRWYLAAGSSAALIIANSCGDFASSSGYGFWGQVGFATVVFFLTFVAAILTIMAFRHAFHLARLHAKQIENEQ